MAEWLEQPSQWHEVYCHDLEAMSSNPGWVELGVRSTSVLSRTRIKILYGHSSDYWVMFSEKFLFCHYYLLYSGKFVEVIYLILFSRGCEVVRGSLLWYSVQWRRKAHTAYGKGIQVLLWPCYSKCDIFYEGISYLRIQTSWGMSFSLGSHLQSPAWQPILLGLKFDLVIFKHRKEYGHTWH